MADNDTLDYSQYDWASFERVLKRVFDDWFNKLFHGSKQEARDAKAELQRVIELYSGNRHWKHKKCREYVEGLMRDSFD